MATTKTLPSGTGGSAAEDRLAYGVRSEEMVLNHPWFSYRRQIPAGLNFALSGIPYWTPCEARI